ncbi:putative ntf2 and rrm domain containing protein [Naviculisporaceae sp. PSN 640]
MATNGNHNHVEQYANSSAEPPASTTSSTDPATNTQRGEVPGDEVAWYFVQQYYTTLSKTPEKLHLFYGKRAQFVYGLEGKVADVNVGRSAIQQRIKNLDFQEVKVRVTNVDSQLSNDCIVIQVIGEISQSGEEEPKKFVQTFVLAQQPSGYFVLNDIFRYLVDEEPVDTDADDQDQAKVESPEAVAVPEPEAEAQAQPTEVEEAPKEQEPAALDAAAVDQKLEETEAPAEEIPAAAEPAPEAAAPEVVEEEKASEPAPDPEKAAEEVAEEDVKQPEEPKAPTPTPAVVPVAPAATPTAAEPEKPKEPAKALSWADRVAASAAASGGSSRKVVPALPKNIAPQARPAAAPAKPPTPATPVTENTSAPAASQDQGNEWQTAEARRQNRPQSQVGAPAGKESASGYIRNVTDRIRHDDLRAALAKFGELSYFDINRSKNCAFVEFKTQDGYDNAVKANPLTVNGETIVVEPRRHKTDQFRGSGFNAQRGGAAGRGGRGGVEPGRSGSQGGRGGFPSQPRGGRGGAPRGRGGQTGAV